MKLQRDLREFIELLNSTKARYVIVGGYAVAYHGHPRFTGDIDLLVESSPENATALVQVLRSFGFGELGVQAGDFLSPDSVVQLGVPPNRIDLLTSISGVDFADVWSSRVDAQLDGLPVCFISKDLLLQNKRAAGRAKDLADVSQLAKRGRPG